MKSVMGRQRSLDFAKKAVGIILIWKVTWSSFLGKNNLDKCEKNILEDKENQRKGLIWLIMQNSTWDVSHKEGSLHLLLEQLGFTSAIELNVPSSFV